MYRNILSIALLLFSLSCIAQDDIPRATWISPVTIDGNAREWAQPLQFYDNITKLFFAFANDKNNIYLCFQSNDDLNQMRIMRAGMKVSISTKGKDKHKVTISYPIEQKTEPTPVSDENPSEKKYNRENRKNIFLVQNTMMEVKGFTTKNGLIAINDSSGINVAINWDASNKLIYEIAIPLKELFGNDYTADDLTKDISLSAEINALKAHSGSGANNFSGKGGGRRMGSGERGEGRNRGDQSNGDEKGGGQMNAERAALYEKAEFKQRFFLTSINNPG